MIDRSRYNMEFIGLTSPTAQQSPPGNNPCQGIYWTLKGAPRPRVAIIASHYNHDFVEHYLAPYMAERGIGFLGWNNRYRGAEDQFILEHGVIDIAVGMRWLKEVGGAETIVLLGNSGGGSLMAAYQGEAKTRFLAKDASGVVADALHGIPQGDLYISLNAHPGRPEIMTAWMDASVVDERDPTKTDESLNPYNPDNGPPYSPEFITRYRAAQKARNQRITDWVKKELPRLNAAGIPDNIFSVFRTKADLRLMDPGIDPSDRPCPGTYGGHPSVMNRVPFGLGRTSSLKTWLSMWSLETSKCTGDALFERIDLPAFVIQSTGDWSVFNSEAKRIYEALGSKDKQSAWPKGLHCFDGSHEQRNTVADMMSDWIKAKT
jgi:hypothetical protein